MSIINKPASCHHQRKLLMSYNVDFLLCLYNLVHDNVQLFTFQRCSSKIGIIHISTFSVRFCEAKITSEDKVIVQGDNVIYYYRGFII